MVAPPTRVGGREVVDMGAGGAPRPGVRRA